MESINTEKPSLDTEKPSLDEDRQNLITPIWKRWPWLLAFLLILGGGVSVWRFFSPSDRAPALASVQTPPRPVETIPLAKGSGTRRIALLGQVEASGSATIRSRTDGVVQQILVQPGDRVTAGMTIAVLDNTNQQLAVREAEARLAQARSSLARLEVGTRKEVVAQRRAQLRSAQAREKEALDNLKRNSELVKEGVISERLLVEAKAAADTAEGERLTADATLAEAIAGATREEIDAQRANTDAAQAALNQARVSLGRTEIKAVSNGIVQTRVANSGDYVRSADPVVALVNSEQVDVFLELPEELSGRVTSGMPLSLKARALPQWQGKATITGVVPAADAASRRQRIRVRLDNPPKGLLAGMAIAGELDMPSNSPSFIVPRDALTRRENKWLLFSIADGKAQQFEVEMITDMGAEVAIYNEQLQVGQPVVVVGGDALSNGVAVKASEFQQKPEAQDNKKAS
jgi:HlyD family secretion protein